MYFGVLINLHLLLLHKHLIIIFFQPRNGRTIEGSGKWASKVTRFCSLLSIMTILVTGGVTEKYCRASINLAPHVDVSYGHWEVSGQKCFSSGSD